MCDGVGVRLTFNHQAKRLLLPEHREGMPEGWEHGIIGFAWLPDAGGPSILGKERYGKHSEYRPAASSRVRA